MVDDILNYPFRPYSESNIWVLYQRSRSWHC